MITMWVGAAFILWGFWYGLVEHEDDAAWLLTGIGTFIWWIMGALT